MPLFVHIHVHIQSYTHTYIYIYIHIYREREAFLQTVYNKCIHLCIYIFIHMPVFMVLSVCMCLFVVCSASFMCICMSGLSMSGMMFLSQLHHSLPWE